MTELEEEESRQALAPTGIIRFRDGDTFPVDDVVAREEPLEVRLNNSTLVYLMRLPGDDMLLAAGFCYSEGLIKDRGQIELMQHCLEGGFAGMDSGGSGAKSSAGPGNLVEIRAKIEDGAARFSSARVVRTGCGGADLDREVDLAAIHVDSDQTFSPDAILRLPDMLLAEQEIFRVSGGTHGAGLFDRDGNVMIVKEDVGRHNAVDKVLGYLLMAGGSPDDKGIILSGRLSYEMVLKAARAGIPLLCSVSAPTALGVEVGRKTGVTLVGFLRGAGFNIYSHPSRIGEAG
ncbi:MAG: formate dehydrogenase accessory sulfurtransferase FdhD [Candidatus Geothermincolia bacterium]